jgi:hypothetical protein
VARLLWLMCNCSRPERVAKIAEVRYGLDPTAVLDNIRVARVYNVDDQIDSNYAIAAMLAEEEGTSPNRWLSASDL